MTELPSLSEACGHCAFDLSWEDLPKVGMPTLKMLAKAANDYRDRARDTVQMSSEELEDLIRRARAGENLDGVCQTPRSRAAKAAERIEALLPTAPYRPLLPRMRSFNFFGLRQEVFVFMPGRQASVDVDGGSWVFCNADGSPLSQNWIRGRVVDGWRHGDGAVHVAPETPLIAVFGDENKSVETIFLSDEDFGIVTALDMRSLSHPDDDIKPFTDIWKRIAQKYAYGRQPPFDIDAFSFVA